MRKTIWLKTIYEKRWGLIAWYASLFVMTIFIMLLFPTLRDTFGQALKDVPDSIKGILGDAETYQRINGFIDIQVLFQMVFMTVIYGVILFTGVLAGDENEGTLQTLLTQPVSRKKVYIQKFFGATLLLALVCSSVYTGVLAGSFILGESVNWWRLLLAVKMLFLVSLVFSVIGYAIGAITGRRGLAGAIAGALAFVSYLITNLTPSVKSLATVNRFSPYEYFNKPSILDNGLQVGDVLILLMIVITAVIIGGVFFVRRNIPQK